MWERGRRRPTIGEGLSEETRGKLVQMGKRQTDWANRRTEAFRKLREDHPWGGPDYEKEFTKLLEQFDG